MSVSLTLLKKIRCRFLDKTTGQPLAGVVASLSLALGTDNKASIPVGTLRSDATGYLAFDLQPLISRGLETVTAVLVSAPQVGLKDRNLFDTLVAPAPTTGGIVPSKRNKSHRTAPGSSLDGAQGTSPLCIEFPIYAEPTALDNGSDCQPASLASIQSPDDCDYELSPYSFVTPVSARVGAGCCETLAPSTLPVQEHGFYKVVVRRDAIDTGEAMAGMVTRAVDVTGILTAQPPAIKLAEVLEYRQRWYALGHSLGEIKYSLPLAPGETTQLAVIEWSRQDTASRADDVRATEYLQHELRRDRSIEESVDAGLQESQGGWSWMGGLSTGAAYDAGPYGKYTGNAAAGGGVSNSWGQRDLEADSLQDLHDNVTQGTAYVRSLTSTVIVQASQAEQNALQTRRVANHNHCHALTIQYYEVLRHFRLETAFTRRRKAILIPFTPFAFSWQLALRFRTVLEPVLLDANVLDGFDALVRFNLVPSAYGFDGTGQPPDENPPADKSSFFEGTQVFTVNANAITNTRLSIEKGSTVAASASGEGLKFASGDAGSGSGPGGSTRLADNTSPAEGLHELALLAQIGGDFYEVGTHVTFAAKNGGPLRFQFNDTKLSDNAGSVSVTLIVTRPAVPPDVTEPPSLESQAPAIAKAKDELAGQRLLAHLNGNLGYYDRAVWTLMDPSERRLYLEGALHSNTDVLSAVDDRPIAVSGNYVAFPYNGPVPNWTDERTGDPDAPLQSIVTLPTRGLFAEAQLGHCNSCEKRDVTRMWDWTEMTAEEPPVISGIQPGPHGEMPSLSPTPLPSNVIQITQPPAAADPTGLATALGVLKTPDIFRDMSGLDDVSALLGKLADGTITSLGDMMKAAGEAKDKVDAVRESKNTTGTASDTKGPSASDLADRFSLLPEIKSFAKDLGLDEDELKDFALNQVYGTKPAPETRPAPNRTPKPKPGQVQIQFQIVDAWTHFVDANFECVLKDDVIGEVGPLIGRFRKLPAGSADEGRLQGVSGVTRGVLNVRVRMLSESYEHLSSEVVDVQAIDIPYAFPAGTTSARFTARQEVDEVKVTVGDGETLRDALGGSLAFTGGGGVTIEIVKANFEGTYGKNWETELQKTQNQTREYTLRVPKASLEVKQVSPPL